MLNNVTTKDSHFELFSLYDRDLRKDGLGTRRLLFVGNEIEMNFAVHVPQCSKGAEPILAFSPLIPVIPFSLEIWQIAETVETVPEVKNALATRINTE